MSDERIARCSELFHVDVVERERNCKIVERITFEKRSEILIDKFECSAAGVVSNLDMKHVSSFGLPAAVLSRTAGIWGELESDEKSDGGLCEVSHFVEIQRVD